MPGDKLRRGVVIVPVLLSAKGSIRIDVQRLRRLLITDNKHVSVCVERCVRIVVAIVAVALYWRIM